VVDLSNTMHLPTSLWVASGLVLLLLAAILAAQLRRP
jgi:hypothetical protein